MENDPRMRVVPRAILVVVVFALSLVGTSLWAEQPRGEDSDSTTQQTNAMGDDTWYFYVSESF